MRLLLVNMTIEPVTGGGSAMRTVQVSRALTDRGMHCTIATAAEPVAAAVASQLQGVNLVHLPVIGGRFRLPIGGWSALDAAMRQSDVALLINHWTPINAVAYRAARLARVPYVVNPAGALPLSGGRSTVFKRVYNAVVGRAIVANAAAHVAVTADEVSQFAAYGVEASRVVVIPNGMPRLPAGDGAAFRKRFDLPPSSRVILFIGRLAPIKGPDLLIEAFARAVPRDAPWRLVLAGPDDGMRKSLEAQVQQAGVASRVQFAGFLNDAGKADALDAAELVAVPSRREAMSIVVLEAAAASTPVLITDQCGVAEVEASRGGWIVPATVDGLADGLTSMLREADTLVQRGHRWHDEATRRYGWSEIAAKYLAVFTRAIAGASAVPLP